MYRRELHRVDLRQRQFCIRDRREAGVSLRLRAVQVVEYKEMEDANPFGAVNGFTAQKEDNSFGLPPTQAEPQKPPFDPDMGDEIPF